MRLFNRLAPLGLLPFLVGAGPMPSRMPTTVRDDSIERYVSDLQGSDPQDRVYAARALRSELRIATRKFQRAKPGSFTYDDAITTYDDFRTLVMPACLQVLGQKGVSSPCADILGRLEAEEAVLPLQKALASPVSRHFTRRANRALTRILAARETP